MTRPRSEFLKTVVERGFLNQVTDLEGLDARARAGPMPAYIGFDCTADSLHVGSLLPIMLLRRLQAAGHQPIVLMGGGTTKVGDPSGKDEARKLLSDAEIARNLNGIRAIFAKFLTFGDGPADAVMVNNAEWLDRLEYIPFLREYGRHFSVNRMLGFEAVKLRLEREQPLSFLEFNYMVLQAYDFVELARRYACVLQMGGSDQWGNIVCGVELGRRVGDFSLYGLTAPLVTTAAGAKMGKTARGAVWLNAERLSPYDYFQYWRNTDDADIGRFLKLFTDLPSAEIDRLSALPGTELNDAKKILAFEATRLCHGEPAARAAAETARRTFEEGALGDDLPTLEVPQSELDHGIPVFELVRRAGLAASNSEARRLVLQAGVSVNDRVVAEASVSVSTADLDGRGFIKLSRGKKRHARVKAV
ncbi:MAG: tyrosine--tRNA ligase [Pseudomonadota bacterium]